MNKVLLIFGVAIIGFAIVLAGSIGGRLDQPTVTLLIGVTCGVGLALPIGLACGLYIADRRKLQIQSPQQPIVIMQSPTPSPTTHTPPLLQSEYSVSAPRAFNIIGDAEK